VVNLSLISAVILFGLPLGLGIFYSILLFILLISYDFKK